MPLALRPLANNDFAVIDDGHPVGRIRLASERSDAVWMWNITIPLPGGNAETGSDHHVSHLRRALPRRPARRSQFFCECGPCHVSAGVAEASARRYRGQWLRVMAVRAGPGVTRRPSLAAILSRKRAAPRTKPPLVAARMSLTTSASSASRNSAR